MRGRLSLSAQIGLGIAAGVALGLFAGERIAFLQVAGDAYIKLLQMTVLPYVTVSIIGGLGALDAAQARALGRRVGLVLAMLWTLALAAVLLFPLMFPPHQNASFFSTTLLQEREPFDFLNLYIPTNPFHSLANNVVPAVVLFSVLVGAAPSRTRHRRPRGVQGDRGHRGADAVRRVRDRGGGRWNAERR
jgi:Na+/H+-dicarboxylate symporter